MSSEEVSCLKIITGQFFDLTSTSSVIKKIVPVTAPGEALRPLGKSALLTYGLICL